MTSTDPRGPGWSALAACDWQAARAIFERAAGQDGDPASIDGLGQALYWLGEYAAALQTLTEAFAAYRTHAQPRRAARVATQLALLHGLIEGNGAAANGWAAQAERTLDGDRDCAEAGWVALLRACFTSDPAGRARHAEEAITIGRRFGDPAVEFDGVAYLGKSQVEQGLLEDGLRLVDEAVAAVSGGLVSDPWATAEILCTLFHTCELAVDVRRAEQWLAAVDHHVERTGERPTYGICRMHYGGLLVAAGRWTDAERELAGAISVYDAGYRGSRSEPVLRLAGLRVLQGRLEEAERLLHGLEDLPDAAAAQARMHLDRGQPAAARTVLRRFLDRRGRGYLSAPELALLVEVELADGAVAAADEVVRELTALSELSPQTLLQGLALLSGARVAAARADASTVALYERAVTTFAEADLRWELACAHLELARFVSGDDPELAGAEARAALDGFARVGAQRGADAAAGLLRELGDRHRSWPRSPGHLTTREAQVLDLVAEGCTNADIAARLHISVRTVEHHVSNVLAKLGVDNRTEAAAHAVRVGRSPRHW